MNDLGLYRHNTHGFLLGRCSYITYNNEVRKNKPVMVVYTEEELKEVGWIKIASVVLAGWNDK